MDEFVFDGLVNGELAWLLRRGAAIAEHDLQWAGACQRRSGVAVLVHPIGQRCVNPHDVLGDRRSAAVRGLGQVRQPWVQGGVAAVAADLEDVVTIGPSRVKVVGPIAEIGNEICDLNVWLQADDPSLPGRELRQGDRHLVACDDVGVGR